MNDDEQRPASHPGDGAGARPEGGAPNGADGEERRTLRLRRGALPELEQTEVLRGAKPGTRYARRIRQGERRFQPGDEEGTFVATDRATAPRTGAQALWRRVRRVAVGAPISSA